MTCKPCRNDPGFLRFAAVFCGRLVFFRGDKAERGSGKRTYLEKALAIMGVCIKFICHDMCMIFIMYIHYVHDLLLCIEMCNLIKLDPIIPCIIYFVYGQYFLFTSGGGVFSQSTVRSWLSNGNSPNSSW